MRIFQLISSNGYYGAESVVVLLSAHLMQLDCEVTVGLLHAPGSDTRDLLAAAAERQVRVVDLACTGRFDLRVVLRLTRLLRANRVDVLHTHGYKANAYGLLAGRLAGCKLIATCHNWTDRTRALRRYRSLDARLLRRFDGVVAVSDTVAATLAASGFPSPRIRVVHNGIETAVYGGAQRTSSSARPVVGTLARLSPEKGVDILIRALPAIRRHRPDVRCVVAGEGPERDGLQKLANDLGVAECVHLVGFQGDVPGFLAGCTLVVQPSRIEGLPVAVLQAMAAGKPIVATAVGEVPALLGHGTGGLLVDAGDAEALAASVVHLLGDSALRERCVAESLRHARQHFEAITMAQSYLGVYRQVCPAPQACAATAASRATAERAS